MKREEREREREKREREERERGATITHPSIMVRSLHVFVHRNRQIYALEGENQRADDEKEVGRTNWNWVRPYCAWCHDTMRYDAIRHATRHDTYNLRGE